MSVRRALLLNVGSAMFSFIGLYIALAVASDLATKQWIAAVTAGLFLYVGLADMVSATPPVCPRSSEGASLTPASSLASASHLGAHQPQQTLADVPPAERRPADGLGHPAAAGALRRENQLLDAPARWAPSFFDRVNM